MSKKSVAMIFMMALMISLLMFAIAMPAKASPITIEINPTSGHVGTLVEVWGIADTPSGDVNIYWDLPGNILTTVSANETGHYETTIEIPESPAGTHAIGAKDVQKGTTNAANFLVEPMISLSPSEGPIGAEVTVSGTGFAKVSSITTTWDDPAQTVLTTDSDENGSFTGTFTVPPSVAGNHIVTATDGDNIDSTTFIVWSITISIVPDSGPVGTTVAISGMYATPEGSVTIQWDGVDVDTVAAEMDGTYSYDLTVSASTAGDHTISAVDVASGNTASAVFTVIPEIILTPNFGPITTKVTVTGTGFVGNALVDITYDTILVVDDLGTDSAGSFIATFNVPVSVAGDHTVTATDTWDPTITASATFTVIPKITITPTSGPVGTSATITGTGFAGDSTVDIYFDRDADGVLEPEDLIFNIYPTDATGGFSTNYFDVPDSVYGSHIVNATDAEGNFDIASFTVDALVILIPEDGLVGDVVLVTGTGFSGVSQVDVYFDIDKDGLPDPEELLLDNVPTDEFGSFDATFTVPWVSTAGNYLVIATDAKGVSDDATFTVLFVMYTRSNEYFQGDYPSFFIQAVDETGGPREGVVMVVSVYDPAGYLQYKGITITIEDGTVPYCMQFFNWYFWDYWGTVELSPLHMPSDAPIGTWTWKTVADGLTVSGFFEVVEPVDLRTLLSKLDQLLEGQHNIADLIAYYGEKLHLEHEELGALIAAVSNKLQLDHQALADLIKGVSDKLQLTREDIIALIGEVADKLETKLDNLSTLITDMANKLQLDHQDIMALINEVADKLHLEHEDLAALVESVFNQLQIKLDDIKSEIVGIKEKVDGLYLVIGDLEVKLDDINGKLTNIQGRIATIETDIGTIKTDISAINGHLTDIDGRLVTIESDVGTIKTDISSINGKITSIEARLAIIETDIGTIKLDISAINGKLTSIEGNIATITTDIGTINVSISNIDARLTTIEGRLATIETDIGKIKTDISAINGKVVAIEGRLATVETHIGTIKTDISAINGRLTEIEDRLATIETDIGTIKVDIKDIQAELVDIKGDIAAVDTTLGRVETKIDNIGAISLEEIKKDIATIKSDIGTIKVNVNNINANITSIKGRLVTIETTVGTIQEDIDDINGKIVAIEGETATIKTDIGTIKTSLTDINTKITVSNDNIATIQTDIGTIKGRLTTIEGDVATIKTEIGTVKTSASNIEKTEESIKSDTGLQPATVALSLIAAIAAIAAAAMVLRKVYMK